MESFLDDLILCQIHIEVPRAEIAGGRLAVLPLQDEVQSFGAGGDESTQFVDVLTYGQHNVIAS